MTSRPAVRYVLSLAAFSAAGLAVLAVPAVERAVVLPFTQAQARLAALLLGLDVLPVAIVAACSGLDVMILCAVATLAYPVRLRTRLVGLAGGLAILFTANVMRLIVLAQVAGSSWFTPLHVYVWPAALVAITAAWLGTWIWLAERHGSSVSLTPRLRRTVVAVGVATAAYVVAVSVFTTTGVLDLLAADVGRLAAATLTTLGVEAVISGSVLRAGSAAYAVTPECIVTPLMPLYLGCAAALPSRLRWRLAGIAAFVPLFTALAVFRLSTVAVPGLLFGTPLFLTHAFNQFLLATVLLAAVSHWTIGADTRAVVQRTCLAVASALLVAAVAGRAYSAVFGGLLYALDVPAPAALSSVETDAQGAFAILPVFQLAFFAALVVAAWPAFTRSIVASTLPLLLVTQVATVAVAGWIELGLGLQAPALPVRVWTLAAPLLLLGAAHRWARAGGRLPREAAA